MLCLELCALYANTAIFLFHETFVEDLLVLLLQRKLIQRQKEATGMRLHKYSKSSTKYATQNPVDNHFKLGFCFKI